MCDYGYSRDPLNESGSGNGNADIAEALEQSGREEPLQCWRQAYTCVAQDHQHNARDQQPHIPNSIDDYSEGERADSAHQRWEGDDPAKVGTINVELLRDRREREHDEEKVECIERPA